MVVMTAWPNAGSPGLVVKPMSSLFRSAADRASVGIEVSADGHAAERGEGALVHRPGRCRARWQSGSGCRTYARSRALPEVRPTESAPTQQLPATPTRLALARPHRTSESPHSTVVLRCARLPTQDLRRALR